ncbi:patatin-like phospholipase family protein [Reichenbachiella agarivorans]|uniref:Patatin-like phospholipase family protein n=1 Tax=Reichenbachiella agarivorans TaxID=2979464 RepID=A0ABY6CNE5_9BACT|nr:patatin-like phospholipase family protein [Reichenbachiella agarivorans]UXP31555.1 patatin-like phospholipase family protein [Reichenbachiella agarivorans]
MSKKNRKRGILEKFIFSFPIQLLAQYFKSHQLLLLSWVIILAFVTSSSGNVTGIPYLFLDPEYLHRVSFWSFFMCGISFGTLVVSFHITGYILHANKYRFIGLLKKPFSNFSVNNSVIPLFTLLTYLTCITVFQAHNEQNTFLNIVTYLSGFLVGITLIIALLYGYFRFTNKDIYEYITKKLNHKLKSIALSRFNIIDRLSMKKKRKVTSFFDLRLQIKYTDELYHFPNKKAITKVFDQNHLNSVILVVILIVFILLMGLGIDYKVFQLPAAASLMFLFSMVTMAIGALSYWAKEWLVAAFLVIYLFINFLFTSGTILDYHEAFGMNYDTTKAEYSIPQLKKMTSDSIVMRDKQEMLAILDRWKSKQESDRPTAVFVCVSGGGSRSALWAYSALTQIDQKMGHKLMDQTVMITGASGGMVGASFFRELAYRYSTQQIENPYDEKYADQIASDNLNPIIFNLVVNDLFLRNSEFEFEGKWYTKDRGFAFEQQLNQNTDFILDKKLSDYGLLEAKAQIPMILFGPSIMNDGRKLYVSAHNTSFMNTSHQNLVGVNETIIDAIDFQRMFEDQGAKDLKYTSALRMNASFPYVTPNISLPSAPPIKIMDAGVTDNFGLTDVARFVFAFKEWFAKNAGAIVIISIRDTKRVQVIEPQSYLSIFDKIANPISSVYNNLANFQDVNNEYKLEYMKSWYPNPIQNFVIEYDMYEDYKVVNTSKGVSTQDSTKAKRPSLNWHLTVKEKQSLQRNILSESNTKTIDSLVNRLQ